MMLFHLLPSECIVGKSDLACPVWLLHGLIFSLCLFNQCMKLLDQVICKHRVWRYTQLQISFLGCLNDALELGSSVDLQERGKDSSLPVKTFLSLWQRIVWFCACRPLSNIPCLVKLIKKVAVLVALRFLKQMIKILFSLGSNQDLDFNCSDG